MNSSLVPIILAGGKGERFWPLSRRQRPKQFLCLDGSDRTLLQATADRLQALTETWESIWVVTSALLADGVRDQLPQLPPENILVEPQGRDTAPALAWATLAAQRRYGEDAVLGFFPADHWIGDLRAYHQTLQAASQLAAERKAIVTLGIQPAYPAIGYGYIERGESVGDYAQLAAYRVSRFTEKPDLPTAESFLATGRYSWNSGMFVFRAGLVLSELATYAPEIINPIADKGPDAYDELPKISIDYALMEKTQRAHVIPGDFGWDDLGDWNALERLLKGEAENVDLATHVARDTHGAIVYASDREDVVVTIGLEDIVIVRDGNVTLVANKQRTQEIKQVLKQLQADGRFENLL